RSAFSREIATGDSPLFLCAPVLFLFTMDRDITAHQRPLGDRSNDAKAEFLRLPVGRGRCPVTGLTRASLNTLILGDNPKVRSVVVKQPGTDRGVRLVHRASLLDFIYAEMVRQEEERKSPGDASGGGNNGDR